MVRKLPHPRTGVDVRFAGATRYGLAGRPARRHTPVADDAGAGARPWRPASDTVGELDAAIRCAGHARGWWRGARRSPSPSAVPIADEPYWGRPVRVGVRRGRGSLDRRSGARRARRPTAPAACSPATGRATSCSRRCTGPGWSVARSASTRRMDCELNDVRVVAAVRCAPPANKPTPGRARDVRAVAATPNGGWSAPHVRVIVALGGFAWRAALDIARRRAGGGRPKPKFGHGATVAVALGDVMLLGCYHPSQQNTFTGRLTPAMLDDVFADAARPDRLTRGNDPAIVDGVDAKACGFLFSTSFRCAPIRRRPTRWPRRCALAQTRRPARLHPVLGGRTPQHAGGRGHQPAGADRLPGGADLAACGWVRAG